MRNVASTGTLCFFDEKMSKGCKKKNSLGLLGSNQENYHFRAKNLTWLIRRKKQYLRNS